MIPPLRTVPCIGMIASPPYYHPPPPPLLRTVSIRGQHPEVQVWGSAFWGVQGLGLRASVNVALAFHESSIGSVLAIHPLQDEDIYIYIYIQIL